MGILLLTFAFLVKTKIPPAAVFTGALTAAMTLRLAPAPELLKGFSNQGMLTVAVLFIVAAGMYSTGAITVIMEKLIGIPQNNVAAKMKILPPIAFGSAFLNNTPLVAMMIPVIRDLCKTSGLSPRQLYIPLSFASILGGTCTVIGTSTNLVILGLITHAVSQKGNTVKGLQIVNMFDPAWVGVPLAVFGIIFMIIFSRFLLPDKKKSESRSTMKRCYSAEFTVGEASRIVGKSLEETAFINTEGCELLYIMRGSRTLPPDPSLELKAGDMLAFSTEVEALLELWRSNHLIPHISSRMPEETDRREHHLVKVVVSQQSMAAGRKIRDIPFIGSPYSFRVVAVSRDGLCLNRPLEEVRIQPGDSAVLEVNDSFIYQSQLEKDFVLTKPLEGFHLQRTDRAIEASLITLLMVAAVALGWMSMLNAGLLAAGAMLITGCLSFPIAGRSIDWATLVVIACAIGLESAVTRSGLAGQIAYIITRIGGDNPYMSLLAVFLGCTFMTNVITNNAAAAFMFPISLSIAEKLGVSFMPFAITLMISASCAFITPTGYQTNMMVWGPGEYSFSDFVKIGSVMTLIVGIAVIFLTPLFFAF